MSHAVLLIAALLATLPLLWYGPSCGHDLTFHLLNWMDAAHQWRLGTLRPWWCFPAAWNTGEARFLFYPPISWILGALLTLTVGAAHAPVAYTFLALLTCGITMQRLLADYVSPPLALLGASLYLAHPYLLFTATERTAYAELLAAAWLPWMLQEALRTRVQTTRLAIPVALLWLTNTPSAVLATYALAVVLAVRCFLAVRRREPILRSAVLPTAMGYLWGVALSALYLLPAMAQHHAVEVAQAFTTGMRPEDGTLFTHIGQPLHDQVVHQASVLAVLLLGAAAASAAALLARRHHTRRLSGMRELTLGRSHRANTGVLVPVLLTLTALVAFLLTPASLFLWHHLPELHFLQFPWRTLMLQGIVTVALLVLAVPARLQFRAAIPIALIAVTVASLAAHHRYVQVCDDEDAPTSLLAQYRNGDGFEPYDEYTPRDADNDLLHADEPPAWTARKAAAAPTAAGAAHARVLPAAPNSLAIRVVPGPMDRFLIVRERSFPNWHLLLDGTPVDHLEDRDDALIALALPDAAPHTVTLQYRWSLDQKAGTCISAVAALALAWALAKSRLSRTEAGS